MCEYTLSSIHYFNIATMILSWSIFGWDYCNPVSCWLCCDHASSLFSGASLLGLVLCTVRFYTCDTCIESRVLARLTLRIFIDLTLITVSPTNYDFMLFTGQIDTSRTLTINEITKRAEIETKRQFYGQTVWATMQKGHTVYGKCGATGGGHTGQRRIIIFIPIPVLPDDGTSLRRRRRRMSARSNIGKNCEWKDTWKECCIGGEGQGNRGSERYVERNRAAENTRL